jgi:hypothetical protein
MVEYGHGVGEVAGRSGGGGGGSGIGGGTTDLGAPVSQFINDSINTISTLPPEMLVIGAVAIFLGLLFLKRAF